MFATKNNWAELEQQAACESEKRKKSQKWLWKALAFEKVFTKSWINAKNYNGHRIQETICEGFWEVRVCSKVNDEEITSEFRKSKEITMGKPILMGKLRKQKSK